MLTVVLGAGASHDSIDDDDLLDPDRDYQPPLAKDLFAVRRNFNQAINEFRQMRPILGRLRKAAAKGSVEEELELIRDDDYRPHVNQLMALRYYLKRAVGECSTAWPSYAAGLTNYVGLVYQLDRWRESRDELVNFVSFNYDNLLERAIQNLDINFATDFGNYASASFRLFKPHGSIDWGFECPTPLQATSPMGLEEKVIDAGIDLSGLPTPSYYHSDQAVISSHSPTGHGHIYRPLVPAIAIPTTKKSDFVMPPQHFEEMKRTLGDTDRLIVIGWRASEQHFLRLWNQHQENAIQRHLVVAESEAAASRTFQALSNGGIRLVSGNLSGHGFTGLVKGGILDEFLNS